MAKTGKIYYVDVEFTDAQVAAQFAFPCMFFLRNAAGQIIKHITYDLNGEKSVAIYSVPEDRVLTIGTITATTTILALALHTSGVNSVLMSGVERSKTEDDDFTFAPVSAGKLKYVLLYSLPDTQLFHIVEGAEGNEAIYPDVPPGALLIKAVLISEFGALLEDADGGYKPLAEDPWRNIVINNNAAINVVMASSPSCSFNVLVGAGSTAPKIAGIRTKVKKNTRDGQEITFYNDSDTPVALLPGDYEETLVYTTFPFDDEYTIKPRTFAKFKRKNNKYKELQMGGGASFPETGTNGDVLVKDSSSGEGAVWSGRLTTAENEIDAEIVNRALADNALQSQITTEKNRNDTQDGQIAVKLDKPTSVSDFSLFEYIVAMNSSGQTSKVPAGTVDAISMYFDFNIKYMFANAGATSYLGFRNATVVQSGQVSDGTALRMNYTTASSTPAFQRGASLSMNTSREFIFIRKFIIHTTVATQRIFVGLSTLYSVTNPTNVALSTLTNSFGVCMQESSSNIFFIWNDNAGSANFYDTGWVNSTDYGYILTITCSISKITLKLDRVHRTTLVKETQQIDITEFTVINYSMALWCVDSTGASSVSVGDYGALILSKGF